MTVYNDTLTDTTNQLDTSSIVRRAVGVNVDSINVPDTLAGEFIFKPTIVDGLSLSTVIANVIIAHGLSSDIFNISGNSYTPYIDLIQESFSCNDIAAYDPAYYIVVADAMVINDLAPNRIVALKTLVEIFNVIDELSKAIGATVLESIGFTESFIENIIGHADAVDSLIINDSAGSTLTAMVILKDEFDTNDSISLFQLLVAHISEIAYFGGSIDLDGDNYTFVLNTESGSVSTYDNYDFNSIAGNLAADSTGIYELSGTDDNGTPIDANFKTGLMDFGTSRQKQVPYVYMGLSNNGRVIFKTITELRGEKIERYYEATQTRDATDNIRVQLGRGVKSRYWQFNVVNVDGSDFDFDAYEVMPLVLKRRI